ncbi:regulator of G-protein signaling 14 isoform X2 [Betta splendens]|uniref:Regulator of G-protein signaling 14 isoform X2 n=1 Tax=Betta splendens TaxID=158456 RepID=A0A6P7NP58_BETSP|nr:regulator of G-protein signaling 14 isoform X2 [Betta splendens]
MLTFRRLCHRFTHLAKAAARRQYMEYDKGCTVTRGTATVKTSLPGRKSQEGPSECLSVHHVWVEHFAVSSSQRARRGRALLPVRCVVGAAMAKRGNALGIPAGIMIQAVSDGELNMSARGCGGSSSSLPGTPGGESGPANGVLSWAVSFEKLLEDPCGVSYFTAFLKSEVSDENILFWQDCEKFRKIPAESSDKLKAAAQTIYNTYLSDSAPYSVNIDDTAKTEKKDLEKPTPDMFNKAQAQIFKLMKMDSYRRFVRSPLYQSCTLAGVEGKLLPQFSNEPLHTGSWEDVADKSPSFSSKKNKKSDSNSLPGGKSASEKQEHKRGSWGDMSNTHGSASGKESHMAVKSTSSVELGALYRHMENGRSSPRSPDKPGGNRVAFEGGYCCVYLPDGSASLAPTPAGQPIRGMLASLCEKRGFPLKDVVIYLQGKDKPLSLDQDCSVLRDQQVLLELRVTFALDVAFTGKTTGIVAKSSKTLQEALSSVLQKHHLKPQDTVVTMVGSNEPVNMSGNVFRLANKTLRLDKSKGKDQSSTSKGSGSAAASQAGTASGGGLEARPPSQSDRTKTQPKPSKNRDMDGFLDMLTRAQCCRVDDQRGLLTKEQLEVPSFLQLPPEKEPSAEPKEEPGTSGSSPPEPKEESESKTSEASKAADVAKKPADSAEPKSKDLKETTV